MMSQIKSRKRVRDFGEVFTPTHIVNDMLDLLPIEMFQPGSTFLEPACGTGNFLVTILSRKLINSPSSLVKLQALSSLYGVDILEDNVEECRDRLVSMIPKELESYAKAIVRVNVIRADFLNDQISFYSYDWNEITSPVLSRFSLSR